jgi:formylglycine-generating enzyme
MKSFTLSLAVCAFLAAADAGAVTIDWSPVGNPGNAADGVRYGAVGYSYNIGTYDVTNSQYVEFLNAKDGSGLNTLGLYNSGMSNTTFPLFGGINFNAGNANGNKYSVISSSASHPVNYVTWYDAIRFANWLNNGQGNSDTESGAYTLLGGTPTPSNGNSITRNARATVFLSSENEWYKAAYYDPRTEAQGGPPAWGGHYWLYPTSSSSPPIGSSPTALPNHVNILNFGPVNLTDVGAYTGTTSPYGAFDMGGNVGQWTEADALIFGGSAPGIRGGSWASASVNDLLSLGSLHQNPPFLGHRSAQVLRLFAVPRDYELRFRPGFVPHCIQITS